MKPIKILNPNVMERLPWIARVVLGCAAAGAASALTYSIAPMRSFPLLFAFPTVILCCWILGMWGGFMCALTEAVLHSILTGQQIPYSVNSAREEGRLAVFLLITTFLGWTIRLLARQRAEMDLQELQQRLKLADAERLLAEERAAAIEALRTRDEMLQVALEANGMGLWIWDLERATVHWSDETYRMIGCEPGSMEPSSGEWLRSIHPDDRGEIEGAIRNTRNGGEDYHRQFRVRAPDGSVRWLESEGKCQRDGEGQVARVVGVLQDVTHRKKTEEAMLRAEKLSVAGRLAASVAHEINNPLEAMANLLYLISVADTIESVRTYSALSLDQLMRVARITQQMLKFHRQTGMAKRTRLSEVMGGVLDLFQARTIPAEIAVEVRVEREASIVCMPGEAQQIFANLVTNAIEAMPRGGRLVIRFRPSRDWRDRKTEGMRVTVCDSGTGMDRATMRRIFEPFFTTKTDTGTGLGMWVVAQLVERHLGHVRVWSRQSGQVTGTVFSVFFPLGSEMENNSAANDGELQADEKDISAAYAHSGAR